MSVAQDNNNGLSNGAVVVYSLAQLFPLYYNVSGCLYKCYKI